MAKHRPTRRECLNWRTKGKRFERKVAEMIVQAFVQSGYEEFGGIKKDMVARTPMSGAWHEKGDIIKRSVIVKVAFPFCIECKCQKAFPPLEKLLVGRHKIWQSSWEQTCDQAIEMRELPLLVWRRNQNDSILCAIPETMMNAIYDVDMEDSDRFELWAYGGVIIYEFKTFLKTSMPACYVCFKGEEHEDYDAEFPFDFGQRGTHRPNYVKLREIKEK